MSTLMTSLRLLAGALLILTNAFFVAVEFALTRVRQYPEEEFQGSRGLRRAWEMTERLEIYLTACQIGITASSIAVGIVAEPALVAIFQPAFEAAGLGGAVPGSTHLLAGAVGFLLINLAHLTHGEQTPTYLGVERTKQVNRYGAPVLYWFTRAIYPLIALGDRVAKLTLRAFGVEISRSWLEAETRSIESRADLREELGDVLEEGDVRGERRDEVMNALEIGESSVADILVQPEEVVALSTTNSVEENLAILERQPHTRFPLVGESLSEYRGIVYVPAVTRRLDDLRSGEIDFEELAAAPMTVDPDRSIAGLVDRFQTENQELALVVDAGEVVGMVTATDAFEAIMGDLRDPTDRGELVGHDPVE